MRAAAVTAEPPSWSTRSPALRPYEGRLGVTWRRWVEWQLGLTTAEARRICRLAEKLPALPTIDAAFRAGELSEGVTEVLARVATPANEAEVMHVAAKVATGAQLQQIARDYRAVRDNVGGAGAPDPAERAVEGVVELGRPGPLPRLVEPAPRRRRDPRGRASRRRSPTSARPNRHRHGRTAAAGEPTRGRRCRPPSRKASSGPASGPRPGTATRSWRSPRMRWPAWPTTGSCPSRPRSSSTATSGPWATSDPTGASTSPASPTSTRRRPTRPAPAGSITEPRADRPTVDEPPDLFGPADHPRLRLDPRVAGRPARLRQPDASPSR